MSLRLLLISVIFLVFSCSSSRPLPDPKPVYKVKVKYVDKQLDPPGEWIGGTADFPVYFTEKGEKIITPLKGFDTVPVTTRSINSNGQIIYPGDGFQLVGDMKIIDFTNIAAKAASFRGRQKESIKPLIIFADSNFLEKGAVIKLPDGTVLAEYEYKLLNWSRVK